jgi:hypothetical protein
MFDQVMARIAGRFGRVEPRAAARSYLLGLLSNVERNNCRQPAEQAGRTRPWPMQRLLRHARWDADAVRDEVRAYAAEHLGAEEGVLIVDEPWPAVGGRLRGVVLGYTKEGRLRVAATPLYVEMVAAADGPVTAVDEWSLLTGRGRRHE